MTQRALFLGRQDVAALMAPADYIQAVETAFRARARGLTVSPHPLHLPADAGGFHAKAALMRGDRTYAAVKINANFPGNPERRSLPTIQGVIALFDGDSGEVLSLVDTIEITLRRTAAATALAARHLARSDSAVLALCGCGQQGRVQAEALTQIFAFKRGKAWDIDASKANAFARTMTAELGFPVEPASSARESAHEADIIVTCTTARAPFLEAEHVNPGAFVAAVGADYPQKNEISPGLMRMARIVVDDLDQCLAMGDLHHAVASGAVVPDDVHADLAAIVTGSRPGRSRRDDTFVFDSTGIAIQDVASAALAYERACARGAGAWLSLG